MNWHLHNDRQGRVDRMTGQTLAEVLAKVYMQHRLDHAERGTVDSPGGFAASYAVDAGPAVTAHLAAILSDPETVEAVAMVICGFDYEPGRFYEDQTQQVINEARSDARAAISVIAERLGVQA